MTDQVHHEEQFCEIIMNLGQWFRRCCLKVFLSGAVVVLLFGGAEPLCNFERGHHGNTHVMLYGIWTSGSEGDVV